MTSEAEMKGMKVSDTRLTGPPLPRVSVLRSFMPPGAGLRLPTTLHALTGIPDLLAGDGRGTISWLSDQLLISGMFHVISQRASVDLSRSCLR